MAYRLELPQRARINDVFHVSVLRPYKGNVVFPPTLSIVVPQIHNEEDEQPIPRLVCGVREIKIHKNLVTQIFVQWKDQALEDANWVDLEEFWAAFPNFHIEEKVNFQGQASDTLYADHDNQNM